MRITKKVFTDLAIYMIGFGVLVGFIFIVFTELIGIPTEYIDTVFILACLFAGLFVGLINILIVRGVVGKRLKILSNSMKYVNKNLHNANELNDDECMGKCMISVDSEDVIGETSESFNELVKSFLTILKSESSIRNFTEIFTNELDLEKLSEKALEHLIQYSESSAGVVLIDKGGEIEVSSSYLIKNPEALANLEIIHKCFTSRKRVLFDLSENIIIEAGLINFKPKAILVEPVIYKNNVLGVILLASLKSYDTMILKELSVYTHGLSLGMHNAIIHDKLEKLAILDPLTKAYNRRFGLDQLNEEFARSVRTVNPLGILMLDIDFFKKVNDTYGHIVGDQVLINISSIIKDNIRKGDILVRYGGEEFLAILPGASIEGIKRVSEKIRRYIEEHTVQYNNQNINVTISIGGTSYPEFDADDIEKLIEQADSNLYYSKENGRNRATIK
jgi:diguanylate cyclase (GGDEF)-like protein